MFFIMIMLISKNQATQIYLLNDGKNILIIPNQILRLERKLLPIEYTYRCDHSRPFVSVNNLKQKEKTKEAENRVSIIGKDVNMITEADKTEVKESKGEEKLSLLEECHFLLGCGAIIIFLLIAAEFYRYMRRRRIERMEKYRIDLPVFPQEMYNIENNK